MSISNYFHAPGRDIDARDALNRGLGGAGHWKGFGATGTIGKLDRDSTQEFYVWFVTQHPKPKQTDRPGSKPRFGGDSLDLEKSPLFDLQSSDDKKKKKADDESLLGDSPLKRAIDLRDEKPKRKPARKDRETADGDEENREPAEVTPGEADQGEPGEGATAPGDTAPRTCRTTIFPQVPSSWS